MIFLSIKWLINPPLALFFHKNASETILVLINPISLPKFFPIFSKIQLEKNNTGLILFQMWHVVRNEKQIHWYFYDQNQINVQFGRLFSNVPSMPWLYSVKDLFVFNAKVVPITVCTRLFLVFHRNWCMKIWRPRHCNHRHSPQTSRTKQNWIDQSHFLIRSELFGVFETIDVPFYFIYVCDLKKSVVLTAISFHFLMRE